MKSSYLRFSIFIVFFLTVLGFQTSYSQMEFPEDIVKVNFSIEQNGKDAFVIANVKVKEKWHINASRLPVGSFGIPTTFKLSPTKDFKLVGRIIEPKPIEKYDELADENLAYHEGSFKIKQKIEITSEKDFVIKGFFNYQTCDEVKCLPDYTYKFSVNAKGIELTPEQTTTPDQKDSISSTPVDQGTTIDGETTDDTTVIQKHQINNGQEDSISKNILTG